MSKYAITVLFSFISFSILLPILNGQFIYLHATDQDIITSRLLENKALLMKNSAVELRGEEGLFVPVKITVFHDPANPSTLQFHHISDVICDLNFYYEDSKIRFFLKDHPVFAANSTVQDDPLSPMSLIELAKLKDNNALNIFITANTHLSNQFQHVMAYYLPAHDWLIVQESEVLQKNSHFIAHEIGHYFSLLHTFNGWESQPFNISVHGERANLLAPDGLTLSEHSSRSKCESEGDYICDTPPDYNFGFGWIKKGDTCHPFDENVYDPAGELVRPDRNNIMGYFLGCDAYHFSDIQKSVMQIDYMSPRRASIRSHSVDKQVTIDEIPALYKPYDGERIVEPEVFLEWAPVEGATSYYLLLENTSPSNGSIIEHIVHTHSIQLSNLENGNYVWKVKPFNNTFTCAVFSLPSTFSIDNSLSVSGQVKNDIEIKLMPNLLGTNSPHTTLYISNVQSIDVNVDILDMNGRLISKMLKGERIPGGDNHLPLLFDHNLPRGIYLVKVYSFEFQKTFKLTLQ